MAENIARIATALGSIEDVLAQRVTPGGMDITAPLDMQGNSLTDVAAVVFASGNASEAPGSIFYREGDWYVVDAVGSIQLTDGGQLNAASIGGIQGDYGGVNPAAVTFEDASAQYHFTHDTGEYADVVVRDVILQGTNGTITLSVDDAITGDRDLTLKSLPATGKSLLVYDSAGTLEDSAVTRATNTPLLTDINVSGEIEHGNRTLVISGVAAHAYPAGSAQQTFTPVRVISTANVTLFYSIPLITGDRIKHVVFPVFGNASADITAISVYVTSVAGVDTLIGSETVTNPAAAWVDIPVDVTDTTLAAGDTVTLVISISASGVAIGNVRVTYDHP
jgi:hypothetical protein